jgi:hypothetical protein
MRATSHAPRSRSRLGLSSATAFVALAIAIGGCAAGLDMPGTSTGGNADGGTRDGGSSGGSPAGGGGSHASGGSSGTAGGSGGATSSGGTSATGGSSGGGAGGATGAPPCLITLTPVAPASLVAGVEVGPSAKLQIQGVVTHPKVAAPIWKWTVTSPTLTTLVAMPVGPVDANQPGSSLVQFPVAEAGTYQIVAQVTNDTSCGPKTLVIAGVPPTLSYNLRVTAAGFPVQEKRLTPSNSTSLSVLLDPGDTYPIEPRQSGQITVMPAYLRITSPATTFEVEGYTSRGAVRVTLVSNSLYDLLVVPTDPRFAPNLFRAVTPDVWNQPITFDQGIAVSGQILGPGGAPLANARMVLKLDGRPSTIGITDASGALMLWTRPGNMSAIVVPPDGSGLPEAQVTATADSSVRLGSSDSSLSLKMEYQQIATGRLTVTVRDVDGNAAVAGARVRLSSQANLPNVGMLTSKSSDGTSIIMAASGSINTEIVSDTNGTATFGTIPMAPYTLVIVPPSSGSGAITKVALATFPAGGTSTVKLARKVTLTGALASPGVMTSVAGASITALDKTGDVAGSVISATADASGAFALQVDPDRTYQLLIQPVAGQVLGRMVVGKVPVGSADTRLSDTLTLPRGVTFTGTVSGGASNIGGAFLQVFCVPSATWCPDATVALAEGMTNPDGTFSFVLPNPAP